MKNLDKQIIDFIKEYPFFTDPIVLFKPDKVPHKKELNTKKIKLKYSKIDEVLSKIESIDHDFKKIKDHLKTIKFDDDFLKKEYSKRIDDFSKIIKIIKSFYKSDEKDKFLCVNNYFWIDFKIIEKVLENKEFLQENINSSYKLLTKEESKKYNRKIHAEEIKYYFEEAINYLWLQENWKVKVETTVISIVHTNFHAVWWELIIPKNRVVSIKRLIWLIAHEIDWHCAQFSNNCWLFSWSIRFNKSESLIEGYALYLEYKTLNYLFWINRLDSHFRRNKMKYDLYKQKIDIKHFIKNYKWDHFRFFRWFENIKEYQNLKDFVYIQWLYEITNYKNKYLNFFNLIKNWAVNNAYIKKYWISNLQKDIVCNNDVEIAKLSAYYIFNKYFYEKDSGK